MNIFSWNYVIQDPRSVRRDFAVNGRYPRGTAGFCAKRDDADEVVLRGPIQTFHFHQGPAAITAAGILTRDAAHAHLLFLRYIRIASKSHRTFVHLDDRQLDRLQNRASLRIIYDNEITCKSY